MVSLKGSRIDALGQDGVAFQTVLKRLGFASVELDAEVLPADGHQDLARHVEYGPQDAGQPIEILEQRLQNLDIDNIREFELTDVALNVHDGL